MKYIRTKYGRIFELPKEVITTADLNTKIDDLKGGFIGEYKGIEVIKQADTIEELCDEFVVFGEHIIPNHTHFSSLTDVGIKSCLEAKAAIYGAIWTKGKHDEPILKSVAKMKGVLPNGEIDWELL